MGFFFVQNKTQDKNLKGLSPDFLQRHGCAVCPLNNAKDLQSPKMLPTGSKQPIVLMLGDAPSVADDSSGNHFSGKTGSFLRKHIPDEFKDKLRWNHIINCRTTEETPDNVSQQCCSPRFEKDVLETKPKAIFGFGSAPLFNLLKQSGIGIWRGRKIPVNIDGHVCWYYPMLHPYENVLKQQQAKKKTRPNAYGYCSDEEFAFVLDLRKAFAEVENLPEPIVHTIEQAKADIEVVNNVDRIADLLDVVAADPSTGVDIETNCLRPYTKDAKILSIAFSSKSATFAFALDHSQARWTKLERKKIDALLKRFLYEAKTKKIIHNAPFEQEWLSVFYGTGCLYDGKWECSLSAAYILDARKGSLSLDFLCLHYFGFNIKAISSLDRANLDKAPLNEVLLYNAIDARYHRLLWLEEWKIIKQEKLRTAYRHQMRRLPALVLTQMQGVPVNQQVVKQLKKKYSERASNAALAISKDESVIQFETQKGRKFNPSSPPDVNYLLKNVLKIDLATTAKGELAQVDHPIANLIVAWREPNKVLSTYIESVEEGSETTNLFPDKKLHPIFSSTTVVTWRTSSTSPNAQNWSKHNKELKEVRSQISDPDMVIVSIDYAGIQARNVAMESGDKKLVNAYWNNYDIHSDWRDRIVKKYPKWMSREQRQREKETKEFRQAAKNKFVFATFFGAQSYTTSEGLGIPRNICEELREEFFDEFPDIEKWHKNLHKFYYQNGYVTGLSGFRRRAPVSGTELINTPIQSDESIIVLDAMIRLAELQDPRYQPILEVHDDLTFLMPKKEVEKRLEVIVREMINVPFEWAKVVPIEVEASWGPDWINMTKIGTYSNDKWNGIVQIKQSV